MKLSNILLIAVYLPIMCVVPATAVYVIAVVLGSLGALGLVIWAALPLRSLKNQKSNSMWPAFILQLPIVVYAWLLADPLLLIPVGIVTAILAVRNARGLI